MTRKDPAELFFGSDFYDDEHVLRMSYEAQGVYRRLLWISHRNEGIPDDPVAIAELLGLPRQGLTVRRFLSQVWPRILPCWTASAEGRLVQMRQEAERERRAVAKGEGGESSPTGSEAATSRSERMRAVAMKRWGRRGDAGAHAHADAATHADADASRNADAYAQRNACRNAGSHPPPAPPPVPNQAKYPNASDAARIASPHAHAHAGGGADAAPESAAAEPTDAVVQLQKALLKTGYRSKMPPFDRSRELMKRAAEFLATGLSPFDVADLGDLDAEKAEKPGALLAHWLEEGIWREVLDEKRQKAKERELRRREPAGDPLAGVYAG